jgi:hypothetical protein
LTLFPEEHGESRQLVLRADGADFAKWVRAQHPELAVTVQHADRQLVFRSGDCWLPLVFLASDITLPIYLNLVSSYLYDKMKGALRGETARVHLTAEYEDPSTGLVKRFTYDGDAATLRETIKKFNLNQFLDG